MSKNPQVLGAAFKSAKLKLAKIAEHNITADMSIDDRDLVVIYWADAKAEETGEPADNFIKGQEWYLNLLIKFAGMTAQERLDYEYDAAFGDIASEAEMLTQLGDDKLLLA